MRTTLLSANALMRLLMVLAAMVLMAVGHPANAQRLPGSNSELGCKELNEVMASGMEKGEDFLDCSKQDDKNYIHLQSPKSCVTYVISQYGALFVLNKYGYPPLVPYRHILRGCYRMVLGISQAEYDEKCTNACVPRPH